jgi:hemerythrin-like domain-containing protein
MCTSNRKGAGYSLSGSKNIEVLVLSCAKTRIRIRRPGMSHVAPSSPSSGDLPSLLVQDHALMETRLAALVDSMNAMARGGDVDAHFRLVADTLDFFATEGARHESVEETLLFPRLRPLPQFGQILSAIEFQHRMNRAEAEQLRSCVERRVPGPELRRLVVRFVEMHRGHAVAEERALFPLLASALDPKALEELGREARKRLRPGESDSR